MLKNIRKNIESLKFKKQNIKCEGFEMTSSSFVAVDSTIKRWIRNTQDILFYPGRGRYKIRFRRFPVTGSILCELEIRLKFRKWQATVVDVTLFGALHKAFDNLVMTDMNNYKTQKPRIVGEIREKVPQSFSDQPQLAAS